MLGRLTLICVLIVSVSCQTIVNVDIPHEKPMVAVNSIFSPDSVWIVQVSYSRNILDSRIGYFDPVGDAIVTILDGNNQPVETLIGGTDEFSFHRYMHRYKGVTKPLPGETYTAQIKVKNESFKAISHIPESVPISSLEVDSALYISQEGDVEMKISFKDPAATKNYYEIKVLRNTYYMANQDTIRFIEDIYVEPIDATLGNDPSNGTGKLLDDQFFNGKNYELRIRLRSYSLNPRDTERLRVVLMSVTEDYFKYFVSQSIQNNTQGDPFAQPVLIYSNVENGLGIFAGYSASVIELK